MFRFLATLLAGAALALAGQTLFPALLPHSPAVVKSAAAAIGVKEKPPVVPSNYVLSGPLSASIQAETNKKYEEALKEVAAYQKSGGDAFVASLRAGWLYYLKGAYPEAEQSYANANRVQPLAINPVLGLLTVAEAMKDGKRIQRAAEAVLKLEPSNYRANMAVGGSCYASRDYRGAAFAYRRILTSYPDDVDARSGLAWADYFTGDKLDALSQFQKILSIYPDYPHAREGYKLLTPLNGGAGSLR